MIRPSIGVSQRWMKAALFALASLLFVATCLALVPLDAHAQGAGAAISDSAAATSEAAGFVSTDLPTLIGRLIYVFLGLLGIVAVVLMIYAGFVWMTAQGNEEKIKLAKQIMTNAVIGLIIIFSSFSIVYMVLGLFGDSSGGFGGDDTSRDWSGLDVIDGCVGYGCRGTALGNGIIEYHYPENGQRDVPRNTRISMTFKKPLKLSTVFKNYDDKNTYDVSDDRLCPAAAPCDGGTAIIPGETALLLNTNNFRVISVAALGQASAEDVNVRFDERHPTVSAIVDPAPFASVTAVNPEFSVPQSQTIVIRPVTPIGSATTNVNYRVALRGGESGVAVWTEGTGTAPETEAAFDIAAAEGGYFWSFETNTTIDVTPPRISTVIPSTTKNPGLPTSSILDRNQLLQLHFNEPVDPTTASGIAGATGGFNIIEVRATCLPGMSCDAAYASGAVVPGTFALGNRYRTAEFTPSTPCDGFPENSCGETVYCLPRNVSLTVTVKAATIDGAPPYDPEPPTAVASNGVLDMTGNSLDGNRDGAAQGPQSYAQPGGRDGMFNLNNPQTALFGVSDTAFAAYHVGSNVDLIAPTLTAVDPPPLPDAVALYPAGPSMVPVDAPIVLTWSKVMSITSMRTGAFDEDYNEYKDEFSTIVLRSNECAKIGDAACTAAGCPCQDVPPPGYFLGGLPTDDPEYSMLINHPSGNGQKVSRIALLHPTSPFLTSNDLGYTEADVEQYSAIVPAYLPVARARLKDVKQNCFWPSRYAPAAGGQGCTFGPGQNSCCNRTGESDSTFLSSCAPAPETE